MKREEIRDWIVQSFMPVHLSLPNETLDQIIDATILYWNTHSGYKIVRMFSVTADANTTQVQLSADIKTVIHCYPSAMVEELFSNHPMWVLLGFITLDRYTEDLMLLSNTFENYKIYLGNDFRWKWIRSDDSTVGGWLYLQQTPRGASKVAVVGTKRILVGEDITDEFIYNWIREHARSRVKIFEGNVLRKAVIIGISNDGESMVTEGKAECLALEEALRKESRWMLCSVRK
jgi:hypothetical protein